MKRELAPLIVAFILAQPAFAKRIATFNINKTTAANLCGNPMPMGLKTNGAAQKEFNELIFYLSNGENSSPRLCKLLQNKNIKVSSEQIADILIFSDKNAFKAALKKAPLVIKNLDDLVTMTMDSDRIQMLAYAADEKRIKLPSSIPTNAFETLHYGLTSFLAKKYRELSSKTPLAKINYVAKMYAYYLEHADDKKYADYINSLQFSMIVNRATEVLVGYRKPGSQDPDDIYFCKQTQPLADYVNSPSYKADILLGGQKQAGLIMEAANWGSETEQERLTHILEAKYHASILPEMEQIDRIRNYIIFYSQRKIAATKEKTNLPAANPMP